MLKFKLDKFSKLALKNNLTSAYPHSLIRSFPSQLSQEAQKEAQKNENPFLQLGESVKQTTAQMQGNCMKNLLTNNSF